VETDPSGSTNFTLKRMAFAVRFFNPAYGKYENGVQGLAPI
jgi:hypothetical protein